MSTHNMFSWRNKKILCGYPLLSVANNQQNNNTIQYNDNSTNGAISYPVYLCNMKCAGCLAAD